MIVLAIDPGPEHSGWVLYDSEQGRVLDASDATLNRYMFCRFVQLHRIAIKGTATAVVFEWMSAQGRHVGESTFATCWWIGYFQREAEVHTYQSNIAYMTRGAVLWELFGRRAVKGADSAVTSYLYDRFGKGTPSSAKGTKAAPGPCYGVKGHAWQALGLAVAYVQRESGRAAA